MKVTITDASKDQSLHYQLLYCQKLTPPYQSVPQTDTPVLTIPNGSSI